ncbi:hypothetical protein V6N11_018746 [Hibiscus sabdariffa]|uniref:Secreted protein n=1 Tax=Hibiscus sabdariffa TaxID=183260 RepID=A0ABR2QT79_9ROSI
MVVGLSLEFGLALRSWASHQSPGRSGSNKSTMCLLGRAGSARHIKGTRRHEATKKPPPLAETRWNTMDAARRALLPRLQALNI